ncbi:MAG: protein translocase subunit SecF, partial [Mycobacterium sp.]
MSARHQQHQTATSRAVEAPEIDSMGTDAPRHGFFVRLYTGTGAFQVMGKRRAWYTASAIIVAIAVGAILLRGFTFGIDFEGGTKVSFPRGDAEQITAEQVETVFG